MRSVAQYISAKAIPSSRYAHTLPKTEWTVAMYFLKMVAMRLTAMIV